MRVVVFTPPEELISLEDAKEHLRVISDEEDNLITALVAAASGHIDGPEGWLGRCIGVQTLDAFLPSFQCGSIRLPYPPAIEITEIQYAGAEGAPVTLSADAYALAGDLLRPRWPAAWPQAAWQGCDGEAVRVRYKAGYSVLPPAIRAAILLMVGDLWANRQTVAPGVMAEIPMSIGVQALLSPFRVFA